MSGDPRETGHREGQAPDPGALAAGAAATGAAAAAGAAGAAAATGDGYFLNQLASSTAVRLSTSSAATM